MTAQFKCEECGAVLYSPKELEEHKKVVHNENVKVDEPMTPPAPLY